MSDSSVPYGLSPIRLLCPWGFSKQEYWSGLPCPTSGNLPDSGIKPASLMFPSLASRFFTTSTSWGAHNKEMNLHFLWMHGKVRSTTDSLVISFWHSHIHGTLVCSQNQSVMQNLLNIKMLIPKVLKRLVQIFVSSKWPVLSTFLSYSFTLI